MTELNDKDHAAQMADMKSFDEPMPSVGFSSSSMTSTGTSATAGAVMCPAAAIARTQLNY